MGWGGVDKLFQEFQKSISSEGGFSKKFKKTYSIAVARIPRYYTHKFQYQINPFHASILFLYPLKTSERQMFSYVFRGYRNGTLAWKELMHFLSLFPFISTLLSILQRFFSPEIIRKSFYTPWKPQKTLGSIEWFSDDFRGKEVLQDTEKHRNTWEHWH